MSNSKFPKLIDYQALKNQLGDQNDFIQMESETDDDAKLIFNHSKKTSAHNAEPIDHLTDDERLFGFDESLDARINPIKNEQQDTQHQKPGLSGTRLRSYAFAVLTRKEYSKKDLIEKLALYAEDRDEVLTLVDELSRENYQSDQRVAEMLVRSQTRKGKGPNRIKLALRAKSIDHELAKHDMNEIDWYEEAYQLKVKKYGIEVSKDPKIKAKQIRFLQYRGFEMDAIIKAINRKEFDSGFD